MSATFIDGKEIGKKVRGEVRQYIRAYEATCL